MKSFMRKIKAKLFNFISKKPLTVRNKSDILIKLSQGRGTKGIDRTVTLCYTKCPPHSCYGGLLCLLQNIAEWDLEN